MRKPENLSSIFKISGQRGSLEVTLGPPGWGTCTFPEYYLLHPSGHEVLLGSFQGWEPSLSAGSLFLGGQF